jgi:hypothetical protein
LVVGAGCGEKFWFAEPGITLVSRYDFNELMGFVAKIGSQRNRAAPSEFPD